MSKVGWLIILISALIALIAAGCSQQAEVAHGGGAERVVTDPDSGVELRVHVDQSELTVSDRLRLQTTLAWPQSMEARVVEPDWDQSQWTLIERLESPVDLYGDVLSQTISYVLEPFLPGEYTTPEFKVLIGSDSDEHSLTLRSEPMTIEVAGLLSKDDQGELAEPEAFYDPSLLPQPTKSKATMYIILVTGGVACALIAVWIYRRRGHREDQLPSIYEQLSTIAKQSDSNDIESYQRLYHTITRLDHRLLNTSELHTLVEQCESAIYSPDGGSNLSPQAMAKHTLELLGASERGAA